MADTDNTPSDQEIDDTLANGQDASGGGAQPDTETLPPSAAPADAPPTNDTGEVVAPQAADQVVGPSQAPGMTVPVAQYQPTRQDLDTRNQQFYQDNMSGHIAPKTYADLMGKDTLGKIGSYFGLMLSGFGSGLSGQPNMMMQMMDKTIDRDLAAQQQTKSNTLNMYNASVQHELNQSSMTRNALLNKLTIAETANKPLEAERIKAEIRVHDATVANLGATTAKTMMPLAAMGYLGNFVQGLPEGAAKENAKSLLQGMGQYYGQKNSQLNDQASYQNRMQALQSGTADLPEPDFQNTVARTRLWNPELAQDLESKHIAGLPGGANRPIPQGQPEAIAAKANLVNLLDGASKWAVAHKTQTEAWNALGGDKSKAPLDVLADINYGKAMMGEIQSAYKQAKLGGALNGPEMEFMEKQIPSDVVGLIPEASVVPKLTAAKSGLYNTLNSQLVNGYGYAPGSLDTMLQRMPSYTPPAKYARETAAPAAAPEYTIKMGKKGTPFVGKRYKVMKDGTTQEVTE